MSGCCNYRGLCSHCVNSGAYWFTLNTTESVVTCCCHDPHNQPGTIIDWAEYPSQCQQENNPTKFWMIFGFSVAVFLLVFFAMALTYAYKKGCAQRWILRRGRGSADDAIPLVRYDSVYDSEMTTIL